MFRAQRIAFICAVFASFSLSRFAAAADNWTGKMVIARNPDVKVQYTAADGTPMEAALKDVIQTVRSVKGDWLEVSNNGDPGWLSKEDVIPLDVALVHFTNQIETDPDNAFAYGCRGVAYAMKKDLQRAVQDLNAAIQLRPDQPAWHCRRGLLWNELEEHDQALADLNEAIRLNAAYAVAYHNRGLVWLSKGELDRALADLNAAIRLDRTYQAAYLQRGNAWVRKHGYENALADYQKAMSIDSKDVEACNQCAWLLAACPKDSIRDGKKAIEYARRASELSGGKTGRFLDTLATAYASDGQFDRAVEFELKALEDPDFVDQSGQAASERLKLFEKKQAYRDKS
jgi:tetratricopeptide (TPR) repeat protein